MGKIKARVVDIRDTPVGPGVDVSLRSLLSDTQRQARLHRNERGDAFFYMAGKGRRRGVGVIRNDEVVEIEHRVALDRDAALSPDGTRMLTVVENRGILEVVCTDIASLKSVRVANFDTSVFGFSRSPNGIAWGPGGFSVLVTGMLMAFADTTTEDQAPIATIAIEAGHSLKSALQGRLLIVGGKRSKVFFFALKGSKLEEIHKMTAKDLRYVYECEGRVALDLIDTCRELDGIAEACGWTPDDLPPLARQPDRDEALYLKPMSGRRALIPSAEPRPKRAHHARRLRDGSTFVVRWKKKDGRFELTALDPKGNALDVTAVVAESFRGPKYGVSPDETRIAVLNGRVVYELDLRAQTWRELGGSHDHASRVAHLGDHILVGGGPRASVFAIDDWREIRTPIKKADELAAFHEGRVILACTSIGMSGPPSSKVFVRSGERFEEVGIVPIAPADSWTVDGRCFVTCTYGRACYELPNLAALLR